MNTKPKEVQPPGLRDFHDEKDASRGELVVYSLGSVLDEIGMAAFRNLSTLMTIGFGFSPLIAAFLGGLKLLWDGIMDPVVAHISDNTRTKWGRRRPFILVGGILMAVVSWVTWTFMPSTSRIAPNTPEVPRVFHADKDWRTFGELVDACAVPKTQLHLTLSNSSPVKLGDGLLALIVKKALNDLAASSRGRISTSVPGMPLQKPESPGKPDAGSGVRVVPVHLSILEITAGESARNPAGLGVGIGIVVGATPKALSFNSQFVVMGEPLPELVERRTFLERAGDIFGGPPVQVGFEWRSGSSHLRSNLRVERVLERSVIAAVEYGLIEALGTFDGVPFWRALPKTADVPVKTREFVREQAREILAADPMRAKSLAVSAGIAATDPASKDPDRLFSAAETMDIQEANARQLSRRAKASEPPGFFANISHGFSAVLGMNSEDRGILWFILAMYFAMSVAQTLYSATYYALGIEIAPSYEGRIRSMAYRGIAGGIIYVIVAGFLPFCLLPVFKNFRDGCQFLSVIMLAIGIPLSLWCFFGTRERTVVVRDKNNPPSFFRSVREIGSLMEFWRITALYLIMGKAMGIFQVFGTFIIIYYVFQGDLLMGTTYSAAVGVLTTLFGTASVPLVLWLSKRFEKQNAFRVSLAVMLLGSVLKYFCYNPAMPELMFIVPVFYALGYSGIFNVLSTMMADVTDLDELRCGERREGMFGAVMAMINKSASSVTTMLSGALVVAIGFDITRAAHQDPEVFHRMLLLFSLAPAITGLVGFALLHNYSLTRQRVNEIKEQLALNRERTATANAEQP